MPDSDFFRRLGLFVIDGFLDPAECANFRSEVDAAPAVPALIAVGGENGLVDEGYRHAKRAAVSKLTTSRVRSRLLGLQPQLAQHFRVPLAGCESPEFLAYDPGCFFRAHTDSSSHPDHVDFLKSRRVSLVLFLNPESRDTAEGCYVGGQLTLYGLLDGAHWEKCPLPVNGEAGLLVAFRSNLIHEVKPVTIGRRYTIVTWFHSPNDSAAP
jgi:SM-20-related protein